MKKLKNLTGVTALSRDQQRTILGGDGGDQFNHAPVETPGGGGGICNESSCSSHSECSSPYSGCYTYQCDDGQEYKQCGY